MMSQSLTLCKYIFTFDQSLLQDVESTIGKVSLHDVNILRFDEKFSLHYVNIS